MKKIEMYKHYIKMMVGGHINSVLIHSKAGLGKTYTTITELKKHNVEYKYISGVTTAVGLYKLLYDNNDKIIILDDIETMFKDDKIINLLKSALWEFDNGVRSVSYSTTSKVLEQYPKTFTYTGKIIILMNDIMNNNNDSFKALMSRMLYYKLQYTHEELIQISNDIIENDETLDNTQKQTVKKILYNTITPAHDYNIRLLERLKTFVKYDDEKAEQLFKNTITVDEDYKIILKLNNTEYKKEDQAKEYTRRTGKSRITFFRKRKEMTEEGLI